MRSNLCKILALPALLAVAACGSHSSDDSPTTPERPSVILITIDTLRADHLGTYGYALPTSPAIDRFAEDALLFENCFANAPETRTSVAGILTGFLPHETRTLQNEKVPEGADTLAERLGRRGYTTLAVVSNFVLSAKWGWDRGFDVFDDEMDDREAVRGWPERIAVDTTNRALALLEEYAGERIFLWVHYQDPHGPYTPPARFDEGFRDPDVESRPLKVNPSLSGRGGIPFHQEVGDERDYHDYVAHYDGEIRYMDHEFGRLVDALKESGLYDTAAIFFSSDHGEALGERDFYFSHIGYLYNHLTRVPMVVKYGDTLRGRSEDACQHLDLVPTIVAIAGGEHDPSLRGRDLRIPPEGTVEIYAGTRSPIERDGSKFSILRGNFKLIWVPERKAAPFELYNLADDPGEESDLAGIPRYRETIQDLAARLRKGWVEERRVFEASAAPRAIDAEDERRLRSLGYVD